MSLQKIFKLSPAITRKIWGGERLKEIKKIKQCDEQEPIGETWEVSIHKDGPSSCNEKRLDQIVTSEQMPYLVKLIDTSDNLSVQVHPGDEYARKHENSLGKTECWLILAAAPGAGIYLGLKEGVTKEIFERELNSKGEINNLLNFYEVSPGDFFYVPAGAIHAIGEGVFLSEVQQSSGITYRVWDWNRVDSNGVSRELHIQKALDVINFEKEFNQEENFRVQKGLLSVSRSHDEKLVEHKDFEFSLLRVLGEKSIDLGSRAGSLLCLKGSVQVVGTQQTVELDVYEALTSIDNTNEVKIRAKDESILMLIK